jgi:hypothetical protein
MNREPIYAALWGKLQDLPGIVTSSRRLKHWSDVSKDEQPAIFQAQAGELAVQRRGLPTKWTLSVTVYVYVNAGADPDESPAPALNDLLDALEAALAPDPGGFQTLDGLVVNCWISGKIETLEGILGGQEVALVPIEINVNA